MSRRPAVTMQPTALAVDGNRVNSSTTSFEPVPATHGHMPNSAPMQANDRPMSSCVVRGVRELSLRM